MVRSLSLMKLLNWLVLGPVIAKGYEWTEDLTMQQFEDGKVLSHFTWSTQFTSSVHFGSFPKGIGEILNIFDVEELSLEMTQGRWDNDVWGYGFNTAPPGVQLWTWMRNGTDENWNGLTNVLAGLFCGSLNYMSNTAATSIFSSFRPQSNVIGKLRYAKLPKESVCTENLTPWAKLLPCKTKAGLGKLLNAYKIFDANYVSIQMRLKVVCQTPDCSSKKVDFVQSLDVVFDPTRTTNMYARDWSLTSLFDRSFETSCPISKTTASIRLPLKADVNWNTNPDIVKEDAFKVAKYELDTKNNVDLGVKWNNPEISKMRDPPMHISRYQTGFGQERGGLAVDIYNNMDHPVEIVYLETIPWILKLYLHTLKVVQDSLEITNDGKKVKEIYYKGSINRKNPNVLEMTILLPSKSHTLIKIGFDKTHLRITEHPPDANRGFDIG